MPNLFSMRPLCKHCGEKHRDRESCPPRGGRDRQRTLIEELKSICRRRDTTPDELQALIEELATVCDKRRATFTELRGAAAALHSRSNDGTTTRTPAQD